MSDRCARTWRFVEVACVLLFIVASTMANQLMNEKTKCRTNMHTQASWRRWSLGFACAS